MLAKDLVGHEVSVLVLFPRGFVRRVGTARQYDDEIAIAGLFLDQSVELESRGTDDGRDHFVYDAREEVTA